MMSALSQISGMNLQEQGIEQATRIAAMSALMLYLTTVDAPAMVFEALAVIRQDMKHSPTKEEVLEHVMAAAADARAER